MLRAIIKSETSKYTNPYTRTINYSTYTAKMQKYPGLLESLLFILTLQGTGANISFLNIEIHLL